MSQTLTISEQALQAFCQRWKIRELALFGSALRDDFRPESDIDMLVTFADDATWGLLAHVQMQQELEAILQRPVDLISKHALETSPNWIRRKAILDSAYVLFRADEDGDGTR